MVFVLASVMTVSAKNSPAKGTTVTEAQKGYYEVRTDDKQFTDDKGTYEDTSDDVVLANKDDILAFNAGTKTLADLLKGYDEVAKKLEGKTALTMIFDLHDVNGGKPEGGLHKVVLSVPTLTKNCSEVEVLHYSVKEAKWEIVESKADFENKTVTVISDDLSPIAIYAKVTTSPSTAGTSSAWMILAAAALVVLGAGVVVSQKKSR